MAFFKINKNNKKHNILKKLSLQETLIIILTQSNCIRVIRTFHFVVSQDQVFKLLFNSLLAATLAK